MLWKCCTQYASKFGKLSSGCGTGKCQFSFQSQKRQRQKMFKLLHNCTHLTLKQSNAQSSPSQASHSMWTMNFLMFKLDLEKAEEPEIKLPTSTGSSKKQESSIKNLLLLYWLCQSLWLYGITTNCGKFWKTWDTRPPYLPLEKSVPRWGSNS